MTRILLVPDLPQERWPSMDRYASRLEQQLRVQTSDLDLTLASRVADLTDAGADLPADRRHASATGQSVWFEAARYVDRYVRYPRRLRRHPADLVHILDHSYAHIVRVRSDLPSLVTVHDLLPALTVRRRASSLRHRLRNVLLRRVLEALRQASAWIVTTAWMRGEFAEWLGHDDRIHVIPYGVDGGFFEPSATGRPETREHFGVPDDVFLVLHVGSVTERKNVPGVLAAVDGLRGRGFDVRLLQVGGQFTDSQRADLDARGLQDHVVQHARVTEKELRAAYRAADVLLFPSHYEGFGLPLVEAMASDLPVVTSASPATAEVADGAAVVVSGRDPERYVDALERIASDSSWAADLRRRGAARAREFTWAETARRTADVYRALV